jgi:hypothetical protein
MKRRGLRSMHERKKLFRIIFSALLILLSTNPMDAQVEKLNNLNVFAGCSVPIGDFSATTGDHAGFAQLGFAGGIEYSLRLHHLYEIGILGNVCINGTDEAALRKLTTDVSSNTTGGTWFLYGLLLSAGIAEDYTPNFGFHGRLYAGLISGDAAEFNLYNVNATGGYWTQKSVWATAFGYGIGGGVTINNDWDCNIRYITSQPGYTTVVTDGTQTIEKQFKQPSGILTFSLGLILK